MLICNYHQENMSKIDQITTKLCNYLVKNDITYFEDVKIDKIISQAKFLFENGHYNVCYHGKDCDVNAVQLYEYDKMYIIYHYSVEGNDLEVNDILDNFVNYEEFIRDAFTFVQKSDFDVIKFADDLPNPSYKSVAELFHIMYHGEGLIKFTDYMMKKYQSYFN
jgi:hypothetical protein